MSSNTAVSNKPAGTPSTPQFAPRQEFNLWKPTKDGKGAAALFSYNERSGCFFLKMMPQLPDSGEDSKAFDNAKAINIKLGITDIGSLLVVLYGKAEGIGRKNEKGYWSGIFHENDKGSSSLSLSMETNGLRLSGSQKVGDQAPSRYSIGVTQGEAEILAILFRDRVPDMLFNG